MNKATCTKCKKSKPLKDFHWRNKQKKIKQKTCRECQKEYRKIHYEENKEYYKNKAKKSNRKKRQINKENMMKYLEENPCVDCGEDDITVLTFDHVRGKKKASISDMVKNSYSWEAIMREINKCEVRCFNCHMKRTAKRQDWAKLRLPCILL